jgi:hypothetical protein
MAIFGQNSKVIRPAKIFCQAHNFVPLWNFDKQIFAVKAWGAGDVDRGIARVNRAMRARAIGTYFLNLRGHFFLFTFSTGTAVLCTHSCVRT